MTFSPLSSLLRSLVKDEGKCTTSLWGLPTFTQTSVGPTLAFRDKSDDMSGTKAHGFSFYLLHLISEKAPFCTRSPGLHELGVETLF